MPSYRRPRGVVTRPVPDWNVDNLCYGGVQNGFAALTNYNAGCTNQDKQGGQFIIWDCTISVGRFSATVFPTVGTMFFGLTPEAIVVNATPCFPVNPRLPAPPLVFDANYNIFNVDPDPIAYCPLSGEGTWRWHGRFPLAVIPQGWTLLLLYTATQATVGFSAVAEYAVYE